MYLSSHSTTHCVGKHGNAPPRCTGIGAGGMYLVLVGRKKQAKSRFAEEGAFVPRRDQ